MDIALSELKAIFLKEVDHLEKLGYDKINIPIDYYWNIPQEERYDPYKKPENLDIGQISDDWQGLQKILRGDRDPVTYDLVWLSTILLAIGEHTLG